MKDDKKRKKKSQKKEKNLKEIKNFKYKEKQFFFCEQFHFEFLIFYCYFLC